MAMPDPRAALDRLVEIFCAFWSRDPAVGRLHEAMATDPEFAQALIERNERRRKIIDVLVGRIARKAAPAAGAPGRRRHDLRTHEFFHVRHAWPRSLGRRGMQADKIGLPRRTWRAVTRRAFDRNTAIG
jgi:hypothetical protein